jgi:phosphoribosylamine--glycine ligase
VLLCTKFQGMNVLLLGSGGREHALAWKLSQSSGLNQLFIAPGNPGTAQHGKNIPLKETDFEGIKTFVIANKVEMLIVGPEVPLVEGIADFFEQDEALKNISVIGPKKDGAMLEGSKDFSKEFMEKYNIPTAKYKTFIKDNITEGYAFLESLKPPYVLKADGLAAGKGVVILDNIQDAKIELAAMLKDAKFGDASSKVVIEEFLPGIELSVFVLTDGTSYKILPEAKDYKRIGEGDTGLNTGGMGAISPVPFANMVFMDKVENEIIIPTIKGLQKEGIAYKGFIFIGLMKVGNEPYVIEYNCRLGDPETEVVIPRIKSDLLAIFEHVGNGTLSESDLEIESHTASTVIAVSGGYPEDYEKGKAISGLEGIASDKQLIFHAGTKVSDDGKTLTNGGRVLAFTSLGSNMEEALSGSYDAISKVCYEKMYFRKDIGNDLK